MASAPASAGQSPYGPSARPVSTTALRRPLDRALLGGVCAAVADRLGVEPVAVRLAMLFAITLGGIGVALYAFAWLLIPAALESKELERRQHFWREAGMLALAGAGALMLALTLVVLLHAFGIQHNLGKAIWAVAIVAVVLGLLVGPMVLRLLNSLSFERAARIREQERAEVAAHLHDSVLQTLALIQKRSADPREVAGLARRQERELRSWLLGRPDLRSLDSLAVALERVASDVEELHRVPIEVVTVGDCPFEGLEPLGKAAREALTNAAKFAGSERIDLYSEVGPERIEVFVRDRGSGFDLETIPADRRGLRDSIIARMERHGGHAAVRSSLGEGTEVELVMTRPGA